MKTTIPFCLFVISLLSIAYGKKQPDPPPSDQTMQEPVTIEAQLLNQPEDSLVKVEFTLKMGKNIHIFSSESHFFAVKTVESNGLNDPVLKLPPSNRYRNIDGTMADTYVGTIKIILSCSISARPWKMQGYIQYQACDKNKCFFPSKKWFAFSGSSPVGSIERLSDSPPETIPDAEIDIAE